MFHPGREGQAGLNKVNIQQGVPVFHPVLCSRRIAVFHALGQMLLHDPGILPLGQQSMPGMPVFFTRAVVSTGIYLQTPAEAEGWQTVYPAASG